MRAILATAAAAALLWASGCGDYLELDARAPNACVTVAGVHVPGVNEIPVNRGLPSPPKVTVRDTVDVPLDGTALPAGSDPTIKLVSFLLVARDGGSFAFVDSAQLSAVKGGASTPLASLTRPAGAPTGTLEMKPDPSPDVTPFVQGGVLRLEGALTGSPPEKGFDADATICFDIATTLKANL